jgi:hypothetical protein
MNRAKFFFRYPDLGKIHPGRFLKMMLHLRGEFVEQGIPPVEAA